MPQVVLQVCSVYALESSCHKMLWKLYFSCKQIMVHYFWQNDRLIMRGLSFSNHIWGRVIVSEPPHDTSPLPVTPGSAPLHSRFPITANKAWLVLAPGDGGAARHGRRWDGWTQCAELDSRWSPSWGRASVRHRYSSAPSLGGHANYSWPGDGGARSMVTWPVTPLPICSGSLE